MTTDESFNLNIFFNLQSDEKINISSSRFASDALFVFPSFQRSSTIIKNWMRYRKLIGNVSSFLRQMIYCGTVNFYFYSFPLFSFLFALVSTSPSIDKLLFWNNNWKQQQENEIFQKMCFLLTHFCLSF